MENQSAASGEVAETSQNQDKVGASLKELSPEQNAEIDKLIARKEKEWERKHKPTFEKAGEYEKLQEQINKQKESELSEIQKLQKERDELLPLKGKAESLEQYVKTQYEELASELSEEDKETLDALSVPVTEKLSLAKRLLAKTVDTRPNGAARASASAIASTDKLTALAVEKMQTYYPREVIGSDSYKVKLERIKAELKALQN